MLFSIYGLRISLALIALCVFFFFYNKKPKFIVPLSAIHKKIWYINTVFLWVIIFSIVLLPLNLSFVDSKQVVVEKDFPVQIILDVSLSMSATDFAPSRFVAAKESLISLVQELDWYYVSLIAFSWKPFVYIPFSSNTSSLIAKLKTTNLGDFPPVEAFLWTAIGDALLLAVYNLQHFYQQETYKPWMVVLITDGDSNVGFDPMQVVSYYKKIQVPLYILWVGQENYLIGRDSWNDEIMTNIQPSLLKDLADATWWKFYRVLDQSYFQQFLDEFSQDITARQQQKIYKTYRELNHYLMYFLVFALLGLLGFTFFMRPK